MGFPDGSEDVSPAMQETQRPGFDPWVEKILWKRKWQPTPVFLPGKSLGRQSLVGCSPKGCKKLDKIVHAHTPLTQLGLSFRTRVTEAMWRWEGTKGDFKYERLRVQSLPFSHVCKILHSFLLEIFKYKRKSVRLLIMCPKAGFLLDKKEQWF